MPETIQPEHDDTPDPETETEETAEQADDVDDEPEFYIPAPGGLRGL